MEEKTIIERFTQLGQGHLFDHWVEREEPQRQALLRDLAGLDPQLLKRLQVRLREAERRRSVLEPVPHLSREQILRRRDAEVMGRLKIRDGRTALLTVAGGQGSRLGFEGPKGAFPVSPIRRATLFQIFAEKALAAGRLYGTVIPWYIMTSPLNRREIEEFFERHAFFGLERSQVRFFLQGVNPTLSPEGRLLMAGKGGLFQNPDGHGGVVDALEKAGCLRQMQDGGIEELFYFQVDNPLVRVPDPLFLGIHLQEDAEVSSKVIRKAYPEEKLGAIGRIDGRPGVIEYSDLDRAQMLARDERGELLYGMGSIAIHIFRVSFFAGRSLELPLHVARKKAKVLLPTAGGMRPAELEAVKLEKFIFDTIPQARNPVFFETVREEEFAPLKNREGPDSIETCVRGCIERDARWLEECGVEVSRDARGRSRYRIEITPLYALDRGVLKERLPKSVNRINEDTLLA
jgi:UDP-N-acetylglucosamine/UDP-N-acetylgalactosamine diphosphorylase